jgi:hypothetical protein
MKVARMNRLCLLALALEVSVVVAGNAQNLAPAGRRRPWRLTPSSLSVILT